MTDIADRLRHTAGGLINGTIEDGSVEVKLLCDAADLIEDTTADYLRRHHDACDYWMALKLIAEGYGPNHGSNYCRDTAQAALDEANRRTSRLPQADQKT